MPLTTSGVAAQILACVDMYNSNQFDQHPGDCKVSLNNLIRAFSEAENSPVYVPVCEKIASSKCTIDHVIPVAVLMSHLIDHLKLMSEQNATLVQKHQYIIGFLKPRLVLAVLSKDDEGIINGCELNQKMPSNWCVHTGDAWARYQHAKIADKYMQTTLKFNFKHRRHWRKKVAMSSVI